jgi:hypothetical protein
MDFEPRKLMAEAIIRPRSMLRRVILNRWWTSALAALAGLGLIASFAVHLAAYFSMRVLAETETVFVLHVLCLLLCFLTFPFSRRMEKLWGSRASGTEKWKGRKLLHVLGGYALINFLLFLGICLAKGEMRVWEKDGRYYAKGGAVVEREITREAYLNHQLRAVRGFSGHWMMFFAWPGLFFLNLRPIDLFAPEPQASVPKPRRKTR